MLPNRFHEKPSTNSLERFSCSTKNSCERDVSIPKRVWSHSDILPNSDVWLFSNREICAGKFGMTFASSSETANVKKVRGRRTTNTTIKQDTKAFKLRCLILRASRL